MTKSKYELPGDVFWSRAKAMRESVCFHCGGVVEVGEDCIWVKDVGIFHEDCVQDPNEGGQ